MPRSRDSKRARPAPSRPSQPVDDEARCSRCGLTRQEHNFRRGQDCEAFVPGEEAPSVLAARLAAEGDPATGERPTLSAAAERYGVTRQAAHAAFRRLYALPALPVGRPRSANPRSHVQTIRLADGKRADVRLTEAEITAWRAAAGDAGVSAWMQALLKQHPAPRRRTSKLSAWIREVGNRTAALKSEQ